MEKIKFNKEGVCPLCGSKEIKYIEGDIFDDVYSYVCVCEKCGTEFHEDYSLVFSGMSCVNDKDMNEYEWWDIPVEE